jgi:hypothetical protein
MIKVYIQRYWKNFSGYRLKPDGRDICAGDDTPSVKSDFVQEYLGLKLKDVEFVMLGSVKVEKDSDTDIMIHNHQAKIKNKK